MKVTLEDFKSAFALFQAEFVTAFKSSLQKFIVGAVLAASGGKIDQFLAQFTDAEGMVDVDAIKALVDAGMKQCGGQFELPISFGVLSSIGAMPANIKIDLDDVKKFFEQTLPAVSNKVNV